MTQPGGGTYLVRATMPMPVQQPGQGMMNFAQQPGQEMMNFVSQQYLPNAVNLQMMQQPAQQAMPMMAPYYTPNQKPYNAPNQH